VQIPSCTFPQERLSYVITPCYTNKLRTPSLHLSSSHPGSRISKVKVKPSSQVQPSPIRQAKEGDSVPTTEIGIDQHVAVALGLISFTDPSLVELGLADASRGYNCKLI
jgi:hypothetical protein